MIFSGGGLLAIIRFHDDTAYILTRWSEDISLSAMSLVALMLKEFHERKSRVIIREHWVAYIPEASNYIPLAKVKSKRYILPTVGFIRSLSLEIKDLPEEAVLIGKNVVRVYSEHFKREISDIKIL